MTQHKIPRYLGSTPKQPQSIIEYFKNIIKRIRKLLL